MVPYHISIIMDGNGRWAKQRGLPRVEGHRRGIENVRKIADRAKEKGVKVVTFFTFSTENWSRPKKEVDFLMSEFGRYLDREMKNFIKNKIRFNAVGRKEPLPGGLWEKIQYVQRQTCRDYDFTFNLALNYGGRAEIVDACRNIVRDIQENRISAEEIDESRFSKYLYAPDIPDPDVMIRTSGELRISNFLLWELAYAEFYFIEKFWPDFSPEDLDWVIDDFSRRDRRFGGIKDA